MNWSYMVDDETHEAHIREKLGFVGDQAALALEAGRALREARDKLVIESYRAGMTQTEIANLVHIDQSMVSRIITAHRRASVLRRAQQDVQDRATKGDN